MQVEPTFGEEPSKDGRVARGQRTRRKVAEALIALLSEGDPDPTAKAIAHRAGVSLRLVFHHFADMDDLYRAVASLQLERQWRELPAVSPKLPLRTRIARTVNHRSRLYEDAAPVRRATARRSASSAEVSAALVISDSLLTESLSTSFAPELGTRPDGDGSEILAAMDAASSWEAWERLRRNSELPVDAASRVMTRTLTALLSTGE
jgi:TetR/AcrR family transcriptional regulator, regulator of autoinduction and epiphytic fitness